jgi:uncharacterized protein YceK
MYRSLGLVFVAVTLCSFASGCGTMLNLPEAKSVMLCPEETRLPYGGVRMDAEGGYDLLSGDRCALGIYILIVDLPLSAVGDTLTLPYVLYMGPTKRPPFVPVPIVEHSQESKAVATPGDRVVVA